MRTEFQILYPDQKFDTCTFNGYEFMTNCVYEKFMLLIMVYHDNNSKGSWNHDP